MGMRMNWNDFAERWCADWNSHELDRVLAHFAEDVVFTSPVAASLFPETGGRLVGKAALRAYWEEGLRRIPDLHFTIERVFGGIDTVVIQYRNQKGASVGEVLRFDGGKVVRGDGTYVLHAENPAGLRD
jgi:ketosteroid isomerase-like protein